MGSRLNGVHKKFTSYTIAIVLTNSYYSDSIILQTIAIV